MGLLLGNGASLSPRETTGTFSSTSSDNNQICLSIGRSLDSVCPRVSTFLGHSVSPRTSTVLSRSPSVSVGSVDTTVSSSASTGLPIPSPYDPLNFSMSSFSPVEPAILSAARQYAAAAAAAAASMLPGTMPMSASGAGCTQQHPLLLYSAAAAAAAAGHYSVSNFSSQSLNYGISGITPTTDKTASKHSSIADLRMKAKKHAESLGIDSSVGDVDLSGKSH
ncbi:unnamed protein product [Notodromas monacha]|uniref:OAR domain-containing protein n=1 Tax=Notodromas monacha TaxID=399045 RepID=A0A7R9BJ28_9CRUS|nr:unnamed protein product [Notodromas monacha]CAG0914862.1 unnamed protein product [Notodromas monacha]